MRPNDGRAKVEGSCGKKNEGVNIRLSRGVLGGHRDFFQEGVVEGGYIRAKGVMSPAVGKEAIAP